MYTTYCRMPRIEEASKCVGIMSDCYTFDAPMVKPRAT
jgi:hypothetical protein